MLSKSVTVGTERKRKIKHLSIGHCLLQTMRNTMVIILGFDDSDGVIGYEVQHIVCTLRLFAHDKITLQIDLAICELCFHCNFADVPFCRHGSL